MLKGIETVVGTTTAHVQPRDVMVILLRWETKAYAIVVYVVCWNRGMRRIVAFGDCHFPISIKRMRSRPVSSGRRSSRLLVPSVVARWICRKMIVEELPSHAVC